LDEYSVIPEHIGGARSPVLGQESVLISPASFGGVELSCQCDPFARKAGEGRATSLLGAPARQAERVIAVAIPLLEGQGAYHVYDSGGSYLFKYRAIFGLLRMPLSTWHKDVQTYGRSESRYAAVI
jgi:hypothetical protein